MRSIKEKVSLLLNHELVDIYEFMSETAILKIFIAKNVDETGHI